jgi:hypothetical protein
VQLAERPAVSIEDLMARRDPATGRFGGCLGETRLRVRGADVVYRVEDCLGDPWNDATRWTWERARTKLRDFSAGVLDAATVDAHIEQARCLDEVSDVAELALLA